METVETVEAGLAMVQGLLFMIVVFLCAATDARQGKVYNLPLIVGGVLGLCLSYMRGGMWAGNLNTVSLTSSLVAGAVGCSIFAVFYLLGGLGAGDVKLMIVVGALAASLKFVLWTVVCTAFAGMPLAVASLLRRGDLRGGLLRSMRSLFRWRYLRPEDAGEASQSQVSLGGEPTAAESGSGLEGEGLKRKPVSIPYAVAVAIGVMLTVWLYVDRGAVAELPFF